MDNLPDEYFLDIDDKMLDFLEKQGEDCIREIYQSNMTNKDSGQKLLSILIVGIGSAFLLLTQDKYPMFLSAGIGVFTVYWAFCAMYLVLTVLSVKTRRLVSSPPSLLYTETYKTISPTDFEFFKTKGFTGEDDTLRVLRRYRLLELCSTTSEMVKLNGEMSKQLNRARIGTILTPVFAILISAITYVVS